MYAALADRVKDGTTTCIGIRLLAKLLGMNKNTVVEGIAELVERKHVVVCAKGKQRHLYHLTSLRFGMKQRALDAGESATEDLVSSPRLRLATARPA